MKLGRAGGADRTVLVLLAFVTLASLGSWTANIAGHAPYVGHWDEAYLVGPARRMLVNREANPRFFNYPSLPSYLVAGSMAVGATIDGEGGAGPETEYPEVHGPRYRPARPVLLAKGLFALLAAASVLLVGLIAARLAPGPVSLVAPVTLLGSIVFFRLGWQYLNVDIVGCFFVTLILYLMVRLDPQSSALRRGAILGVASGLAVASKYPLGLILVPAGLSLLGDDRGKVLRGLGVLGALAAVAFFVAVPYSLLDHGRFLEDVLGEVAHYKAGGESGHEGTAGLAQLGWYLALYARDLRPLGALLAVIGFVGAAWHPKRRLLLPLAAYAVLMTGFFSLQVARYPRNLVSVLPCLAVFAAIGADALVRVTVRLRPLAGRPWAVFAVSGLLILGSSAGWLAQAKPHEEPRNEAVDFLLEQGEPGARLLASSELGLDVERLGKVFQVELSPAKKLGRALAEESGPTYVVVPAFAPGKLPSGDRQPIRRLLKKLRGADVLLEVEGRAPRALRGAKVGRDPRPGLRVLLWRPRSKG